MKKIKVLMLGWEYPPYVTGGLGTHCYYLTKAMAKLKGVKVYFVTPHPIHKKSGNLEIIGLDISQKFKENGKILSYGQHFKQKTELYKKKAVDIVKKLDFDIIHCQDWIPIETAVLIKNISKKPLVLTMHSIEFDRSKHPSKRKIKVEKKGMGSADRIIAVSNYTKKRISKFYKISKKNITVIYNAVNQKKVKLNKKEGKIKYVLYLGRLKYRKGVSLFIEAANIVLKKEKNIKFLIAGGGRRKYEEILKRKVKKLGLSEKIIFLGYVKNKDYYYKKAYLFVMPSVSEPFGIVPLEALINGTPAIISRQSGISEVLKNCLKFNYWDTGDLAKKILFLVRNKKAYDKLRIKGIKEVKNFTWGSIGKETLELYRKIA